MRAFRRLLAGLLLLAYAGRAADLEFFYGPNGILTIGAMRDLLPTFARFSLLEAWPTVTGLWVIYAATLAVFAAIAGGARGNWLSILALALHVSFVHRNLAAAYGVDYVSCFFLLFIAIAGDRRGTLNSLGLRLGQVQICIIYGYSGFQKLRGAAWWTGDALWQSLANVEVARWDFGWMASFPAFMAVGTFVTLGWEIYFPALVWMRPLRRPMLVFGVALHLGMGLLLGVPFFAAAMVASYALFMTPAELSDAVSKVTPSLRRILRLERPASQ
jgi:hypothetical protein